MALVFPDIDPVIVPLGPLAISWYSLSYVVSILLGQQYVNRLITKYQLNISSAVFERCITWLIVGMIIGARLGYALFYNTELLQIPALFQIYKGGLSFHGGLIGIGIATYIYSAKYHIHLLLCTDLICTAAPIGLFLGRIANFINGELYGKPTALPWGVMFPEGGFIPRHPSQLYEAFLEGIVLFTICAIAVHNRALLVRGRLTSIFLIGYAICRIIAENFRQADWKLGMLSAGQLLSLPMLIIGIFIYNYSRSLIIKQS